MKSFFALICLCLASNSFGQIINPGDASPNLLNFVASSHDLLETYEVKEAEDAVDITTDYWDTSKIRVDYGKDIKFPIHLQFNDSNYVSPISKNKVITSRYGWRKGRAHRGIDIDLVTGDSLFAMFDGVVRFANYSSGHGRSVVVRHFNGLETAYAHLSSYGVKENDSVIAGSYLGKGGTSGNARGSHLHLEVSYQGIQINPEYLLQFNDSNEVLNNEIWITRDMTRPELHNSKRKGTIDVPTTESEAIAIANKPKTVYIVKRGDTLSRISSRNHMSLAALCKLNGINKNATLKIGQKVIVN
ncbi:MULTISPECIES: M23 family metallopeptidase [Bizionia]|uniref:Peptidoglycan DD-metalloendopeptidase family protein n=1 Tax=Bizionia algoritergicola TaxID=291187 RepID=A0A5D0QXY8_9FLAO|nr:MULTISPECIES: M23 family metallopeptidase [Bizionia]OBX24066.1 peptidase [Bizionia sp. APA-3]TYB73576.1 peptidoglycan DD-metalloendopeptidase family protein [Bizionia algoritergicola]